MQALADNPAFWVLLFVVLVVVFLLPTLIALIRGTEALALVLLFNLVGGLSGIGWLGAMILAFGPRLLSSGTVSVCLARDLAKARRTVGAGPAGFPLSQKRARNDHCGAVVRFMEDRATVPGCGRGGRAGRAPPRRRAQAGQAGCMCLGSYSRQSSWPSGHWMFTSHLCQRRQALALGDSWLP